MTANKGRAFFGLSGYHFDPDLVTKHLGLEPTSVNNAGMRGKKGSYYDGGHRVPFFIRWANGGIEPAKDKIIEICKSHNLSPRIGVVLTLSIDKDETTPDVGFGSRVIKFCSEIGAFINVDYELSERV